jgi:UDP-N-acetylglucosamine 2-epimerase (non-hydrolysing)
MPTRSHPRTRLRVELIVGARPNFVKAAPLHRALRQFPDEFEVRLVHTGQHYDASMSDVFFADLDMPTPDVFLDVGSADHGTQTGTIMIRYEAAFLETRPDLVLVLGDVNSTVACALVATKQGVRVGHVEAGLRSFDRTMPEEINRIVTDSISDLLFTPSTGADVNLRNEGITAGVHMVGNIMIDSLVAFMDRIDASDAVARHGLAPRSYALLTLHRPSNVDESATLEHIMRTLGEIQTELPIVFPVHPRTRQRLEAAGLLGTGAANLHLLEPVGYRDFLKLLKEARVVITDSGGIQEESTYLHVPCLTVRDNTERPVTVDLGTNVLVGKGAATLLPEVRKILAGRGNRGSIPPLWDGRTADRIVDVLRKAIVRHEGWDHNGARPT